ncbi:hypothetical protein LTR10_021492 [Elasticomyces elasticus]|uniref:Glycosyltransferase 2-like domain-containing protein n=1 Tax=Exophiala sideris TaxID=1016849 RepID=A0ABR0J9T4_9EURO|nr:hypothetical protein LTR10_021492 [Elasticomyces elasticus]KAK5027802.1 hypothetical protein LTS07_006677 [Exophiala sideris]KAK5037610.1 hypothetical protein LTR13_004769 [Exophiala sideris]KAK5059272.1 hypothetical protein LTR69_006562 [Exophiala sideris]KAK5183106.1 hypothetical protein LTR44_004817 [Eurotiomycetes sp. CCFEE 6388]
MAALLGSRLKAHRPPKISIVPTALDTIPQQNDEPVSPTSHVGSKRESAITEAPGRPPIKEHNINNVKFDVMLMYLRQQQLEKRWAMGNSTEGVVLRRSRNDYICQPPELLRQINGFYDEVKKLNFKVAMTVKTSVIETFLNAYKHDHVPLSNGQQLRIMETISELAYSRRHHYAAFVRSQGTLIVWDEDPTEVIDRAERIEKYLVNMMWSMDDSDDEYDNEFDDEKAAILNSKAAPETPDTTIDDEEAKSWEKPRKVVLYQAFIVGAVGILTIFCLSIGWRRMAIEIMIDHSYKRLAILAACPLQIWLGWFFFMTLINGISQMFGPVKQMAHNSRFYSARPPIRLTGANLPHVTIQCPVYKEGLEAVIHPSIVSIRKAISTYELQGGSANIFINDDGMQVIPEEEAQKRFEFYEDNNIGWVSRPKHAPKGDENGENVYVRAGKFKKASNMNFCLNVTNRVEDKMSEVQRGPEWTQEDEDRLYQASFDTVINEDAGRTWGGGDIRMGDYILIVDSDTRVPEDCLLDAVSEMEHSPDVAIIQFSSGVLNVTTSFFERAITFFTNLVYTAIRFAVANGDVAAFVGHNAIMRWSAVQSVRFTEGEDGVEKFWAENTVSEDFDMALRLQGLGYIIRFSTYCGDGFKEGVSLTVYDELSRWEKYAYGCAELVFQPFRYWLTRGPLTKLCRRFLTSPMSLMAKITIMSYVGTYFAIASAWPLTLMNYFLIGWFNGHIDQAYIDSFKIYFGIIVVFQGLGIVSLAVLRYRVENRSLFGSMLENLKWLLILTVYLGGLSMHLSQAILSYLFSIDMTWGATAKEATSTSFFREVPTILKKFKFTFCFCIVMIAGMIVMSGVGPVGQMVPYDWRITDFIAIFPLAMLCASHFLLPLVLNPGLMQFTF